jgi:hypothetical protein
VAGGLWLELNSNSHFSHEGIYNAVKSTKLHIGKGKKFLTGCSKSDRWLNKKALMSEQKAVISGQKALMSELKAVTSEQKALMSEQKDSISNEKDW